MRQKTNGLVTSDNQPWANRQKPFEHSHEPACGKGRGRDVAGVSLASDLRSCGLVPVLAVA